MSQFFDEQSQILLREYAPDPVTAIEQHLCLQNVQPPDISTLQPTDLLIAVAVPLLVG